MLRVGSAGSCWGATAMMCATLVGCCPNADPRRNSEWGCECSGQDGVFRTVPGLYCAEGAGETTGVGTGALANLETEWNGSAASANPITADEDWFGTVADGADDDWFVIVGPDGMLGILIEVEDLTANGGLVLDLHNADSWVEAFDIPSGTTATYGFGSVLGRYHGLRISADVGPVDYRLHVQFVTQPYEREYNGSAASANPVADGQSWLGRARDGSDNDWFYIEGADGQRSLRWTVESLGSYPKSGRTMTVQLSNGDDVYESFTVADGETGSLQVGSTFGQDHGLLVSTDAGFAPYRVTPVFENTPYESEYNGSTASADIATANELWRGRVANAADADWFAITAPDVVSAIEVVVKSLGGAGTSLTASVQDGGVVRASATLQPDETVTLSSASASATKHQILLTAPAGPVPYEFEIRFP